MESDALYQRFNQENQRIAPKKGQGGFLTGLLPMITGGVGTALGAVGGPVGMLAGGTLGSGLGEFLRQKITGEDDAGAIAREGLLGAVPGVFRGIGAVARAGTKATDITSDVARMSQPARPQMVQRAVDTDTPAFMRRSTPQSNDTAFTTPFVKQPEAVAELPQSTAVTKPSFRDKALNAAQQMEARSGGFNVGAKASGKDPLGLGDSKRITQWLDSKKVPSGSPVNRLQAVEGLKSQAGQNIDSVISRVDNVRFQPVEVSQLADDFVKDISKLPGANDALVQRATEYATNMTRNINSPRSAVDFKRQLDNTISYVSSPDAATAGEQQIARLLRDKLVNFTNERIPGLKQFNDDYYNASDASKYLMQGSKSANNLQLFGTTIPGSGGIRKTVGSVVGQKGRQMLGGGAVEGEAKKGGFRQFVKPTAEQAGARVASAGIFGTPFVGGGQPAQPATDATAAMPTGLPSADETAETPVQSQAQQLYEAAQRALDAGDSKSYATLIAMAENAMKFESAGQEKPLSAEASKVMANAQSGLTSLDQVRSMLQSDPSLLGKTAVPFREQLGGLGAAALGTSSYDTAARNIADVITRLRTGAAITQNEESFYKSQLPQPFDPPETIQQKLQMFEDLFSSVASRKPSYSENSAADAMAY